MLKLLIKLKIFDSIDECVMAKWYHGYVKDDFQRRRVITCLMPLAPFARFLIALHLHFKMGNFQVNSFRYKQRKLLQDELNKTNL